HSGTACLLLPVQCTGRKRPHESATTSSVQALSSSKSLRGSHWNFLEHSTAPRFPWQADSSSQTAIMPSVAGQSSGRWQQLPSGQQMALSQWPLSHSSSALQASPLLACPVVATPPSGGFNVRRGT